MKIKQLKDSIAKLPDDANVELGKILAIDTLKERGERDAYEVVLDLPIIGIAHEEASNEARFVVELNKGVMAFGKIRPFAEEITCEDT
jgi:hypothetical protein